MSFGPYPDLRKKIHNAQEQNAAFCWRPSLSLSLSLSLSEERLYSDSLISVEHILGLLKLCSTTKMGWSPSPWRMKGSPKYFSPLSAYERGYIYSRELATLHP